MSQTVAEPVVEPEVREPETPDAEPNPERDVDRDEAIDRLVKATRGLRVQCILKCAESVERAVEGLDEPTEPEPTAPPFNQQWHDRLARICEQDRIPWSLAMYGRAKELDRIHKRLSAAATVLETYTDGPSENMPGWDAVVVEQIVMRAMEWCEDEAKSLYAERDELHAIDNPGEVEGQAESTESTKGEPEPGDEEHPYLTPDELRREGPEDRILAVLGRLDASVSEDLADNTGRPPRSGRMGAVRIPSHHVDWTGRGGGSVRCRAGAAGGGIVSTTMTIKERVRALVGTPSRAEVAKLWGRKSSLRAAARALGVDRYLPGPPPVEEDVSLQNAAKDEARRLRRLNAPPSSRSQAGITKADRLGANRRKCAKQ